jgi:hypothetical protein
MGGWVTQPFFLQYFAENHGGSAEKVRLAGKLPFMTAVQPWLY